jgi:hypothetical protein
METSSSKLSHFFYSLIDSRSTSVFIAQEIIKVDMLREKKIKKCRIMLLSLDGLLVVNSYI